MFSDLKFAFRSLRKTPGTSLAFVLILALGIGANTAVFSVVEAVLLRPLPYHKPAELVSLHSAAPNEVGLFNLAEYLAYRDRSRAFVGLSALGPFNTNLIDAGEPQLIQGIKVSPNLFGFLGIQPVAGRLLRPDDEPGSAAKVAVLGYEFWQQHFGGQADVVGRPVRLNGEVRTIVGVLPPGFIMPLNGYRNDVVVPLQPDLDSTRSNHSSVHYMRVVGRLAPGFGRAQALGDQTSVLASLRKDFPNAYVADGSNDFAPLADETTGPVRPVLTTLLGLVASLLLLACANLAGLLLVRGTGRRRELAIRSALGCSRHQLLRLLFAECLLLSVAGGLAGILIAQWGLDSLVAFLPPGLPRAEGIQFNSTILLFTSAMSLIAGIVPGLLPLWSFSRTDLRDAIQTAGRGNTGGAGITRSRHVLVSIQIGLAVALLACTGLFLRSFQKLGNERPGADPTHILTARLNQPESGYPDRDSLIHFYENLRDRLSAVPGVEHVGATSLLPLAQGLATTEFLISGQTVPRDTDLPSANYQLVTPGFVETMGVRLIQGRLFTESDDLKHPLSVIVGEHLAKKYFPAESPIGRRIEINDSLAGRRTFEIVGVISDMKQRNIDDAPSFDVYVPFRQMDGVAVPWIRLRTFWVIRSAQSAESLESALRREVHAIDAGIPVSSVQTMESVSDRSLAVRRFTLIVVGFLTSAALLLTIAGIYSVMAYGVVQRSREMGVRIALGATTGMILRQILLEGLVLMAAGAALGILLATGLSRLVAAQLYQISPHDPVTLASAIGLLFVVGFFACWIPARRATRISPLIAMTTE
ncbi:MAG TPA: ABC transporter permease [Candidatus Didemnitutus sp.]|nr:ABC transporter permease [Candidatus Didemnitutus sp.]